MNYCLRVTALDVLPVTALPEEVLREALAALDAGSSVALATVIARHGSAPATPGQKLALVDHGASASRRYAAVGTVGGGAIERVVLDAMMTVLDDPTSAPKIHTFRLGPSLGMCCGGSADVLVEPLRPALSVLLVGAGHVGLSTAPLLASLGFRVLLVDARAEASAPERVGALSGVRFVFAEHDDPEVLEGLAVAPEKAFCVVMTHDHQLDQRVVEWAIERGFAFVGGVGSRAKAAKTRTRLEAKGFAAVDVERVRMPVGVQIGARRPMEIAVAIAGELVKARAEREARSAQSTSTSTRTTKAPFSGASRVGAPNDDAARMALAPGEDGS